MTEPQEIVPALTRGLATIDGGTATVCACITADAGEDSMLTCRSSGPHRDGDEAAYAVC